MKGIAVAVFALFSAAADAAVVIDSVAPDPVRMGSFVIVTGSGLSQVLRVYFPVDSLNDGSASLQQTSFESLDDQHLEVFVPQRAVGGSLVIDANFEPGIGTPPVRMRTENDFNGDSRGDFLLMNGSGDIFVWAVRCTQTIGFGYLGSIPAGVQFVTSADFDGDNRSDILWKDAAGNYGIWLVSAATITGTGGLQSVPAGITLGGVADINGDNRADLVWRDTAGGVGAWLMDGLSIIGSGYIGAALPNQQILGFGDFNDDTKFDIAWTDQNGTVGTWILDGLTIISGSNLGTKPANTTFEAIRDFNGDGEWDFLFRPTGCSGSGSCIYTQWSMSNGLRNAVTPVQKFESSGPGQTTYNDYGMSVQRMRYDPLGRYAAVWGGCTNNTPFAPAAGLTLLR